MFNIKFIEINTMSSSAQKILLIPIPDFVIFNKSKILDIETRSKKIKI